MSMMILVGSFEVKAEREVHDPQEHAAWWRTWTVQPGTYPAFLHITATDIQENHIGHSVSVRVPGRIKGQFFGTSPHEMQRSKDAVGKAGTTWISLPSYCLSEFVKDGTLKLDENLIESYESQSGERRYTFYRLRSENVRAHIERIEKSTGWTKLVGYYEPCKGWKLGQYGECFELRCGDFVARVSERYRTIERNSKRVWYGNAGNDNSVWHGKLQAHAALGGLLMCEELCDE